MFGNPGCLGHVGLFQVICLLRIGFIDTQFHNGGTSGGVVMRIKGSAIMFACTALKIQYYNMIRRSAFIIWN